MESVLNLDKDALHTCVTQKGIKQNDNFTVILQVLEVDLSKKKPQGDNCFKAVFSDGFSLLKGYIAKGAAVTILNMEPKSQPIIRVSQMICANDNIEKINAVITNMEFVYSNCLEQIGEPIEYKKYLENGFTNPHGSTLIPSSVTKQPPISVRPALNSNSSSSNNIPPPYSTAPFTGSSNSGNMNANSRPVVNNSIQNTNFSGQPARPAQQMNSNNFNQNRVAPPVAPHKPVQNGIQKLPMKPPGSFASSNDEEFTKIADLYPECPDFQLKGRVTQQSDARSFQNAQGDGKFFTIEILDKDKNQISCSFFGDSVERFIDVINQGSLYIFSGNGNQVKQRKGGDNYSKNHLSITFDAKSGSVEPIGEDYTIPIQKFDFQILSDLEKLENGKFVDVLGVILQNSKYNQINKKDGSGTMEKRSVSICDQSGSQVELTFWGNDASRDDLLKNNVIVLKNGKLGEFQGVKNITVSFNAVVYVNSPDRTEIDIPELFQLMNWKSNGESVNREFQKLGSGQGSFVGRVNQLKLITQIEDESSGINDLSTQIWSETRAWFTFVKTENTLYYLSCEKCKKKVMQNFQDVFRCENCNLAVTPKARYICGIRISDAFSSIFVSLYDEEATQLFEIEADRIHELRESKNENQIKELLTRNQFKEFQFKILSVQENYNGQNRIQHNVKKIEKLSPVEETIELFKAVNKYLE